MKKTLVSLISVVVLFGSVSYANGIAKQDAELLFGNNAQTMQVATLDKSEMAKTEGEFWLIFWGVVIYTTQYLNAPGPYDSIYSGYPFARGKWKWLNW